MSSLLRATVLCVLLAASAAAQTPPTESQHLVRLETWCVDLSDDFLRDVGVDFRDVDARVDHSFPPRLAMVGTLDPQRIEGSEQAPLFGSSLFPGTGTVLDLGNAYFVGGVRLWSSGSGLRRRTLLAVFLEPFQRRAILREDEAPARRTLVQGPVVHAADREHVRVSMTTQRARVTDYELATGVANPILETSEEGVVLDVRPTISKDRRCITLDVQPTLTLLVGGRAANDLSVEVPQLSVQTAAASVTVPDCGTVLLGGLRRPRQSTDTNLIILVTASVVSLDRGQEGGR